MKSITRLLFISLFFIVSTAAFSLNLPGLDLSGGMLWVGNQAVQTELDSDGEIISQIPQGGPSPILGIYGVGLPLEFLNWLSLEPELSMFGTQYEGYYLTINDGVEDTEPGRKAAPTEIERADSVWLLSIMLDLPVRFTLRVSETIAFGGGVHNVLFFRIPILGYGEGKFVADSTLPTYRSDVSTYYYKKGRFYYPGVSAFFNWKFSNVFGFHVRVLTLFPLFHAWDGEGAAFTDQMMISGRIGLRIYFN